MSLGARLDLAFAASRAEILAVLSSNHVPCSPGWLGNLVWSQLRDDPPAVVSGEILKWNGEPSPRERVIASRGFVWRESNFALRRSIWEAFPFGTAADSVSVWRRQIDRASWFAFSSPDAPVRRLDCQRLPDGSLPSACRVSVVVCTRQRGQSLEATVRSLFLQQAPFSWEVLIVDNGSLDGSLELARRLEMEFKPRLRVVEETTLGLSVARNRGVLVSRGEHIIFLDDDALPADGWLAALDAALDEPGVLGAGGPIDPLISGERPAWLEDRYLPYLSAWDRGPEAHDLIYNELPRGTNMAFRREAFERFGEFSRHLGRRGRSLLSCEETEFGLRLERAGARIRYAPAARVQHRIEGERLSEAFLESRFAAQGRSEAIVDWIHGGWSAMRAGERAGKERLRQAAAEQGASGELHQRCQRASVRAYRHEMLRAILWVPRYRGPNG
jgi:GT2 family glycosyltransferase